MRGYQERALDALISWGCCFVDPCCGCTLPGGPLRCPALEIAAASPAPAASAGTTPLAATSSLLSATAVGGGKRCRGYCCCCCRRPSEGRALLLAPASEAIIDSAPDRRRLLCLPNAMLSDRDENEVLAFGEGREAALAGAGAARSGMAARSHASGSHGAGSSSWRQLPWALAMALIGDSSRATYMVSMAVMQLSRQDSTALARLACCRLAAWRALHAASHSASSASMYASS